MRSKLYCSTPKPQGGLSLVGVRPTGGRPVSLLTAALSAFVLFYSLATPAEAARKKGGETASPAAEKGLPTVDKASDGLETRAGFLTLHLDREKGRVLLEVPPPRKGGIAAELIYLEGLTTGLGSNPIGLDRSQVGLPNLLHLRRVGHKVLFEEPNLSFRAISDDPAEQRAVAESFAPSVLWAAEVMALDADGRTLIDLSPFLLRDAHSVTSKLEAGGHGSFALDPVRSAIDFDAALTFPDNVELESVLTYGSDKPGSHVIDTAMTPTAFTLVQHHSFVRLPDDNYRRRKFDPRMPSYGVQFQDYAVALDEPIEQSWIARHRLEKTDPNAERSTVVEPIIYYVDPGVPEPIRSALVEGASWWAEAFEAAGFIDAYRVELLPEDAHPLDVRYNVVQWVHRSTRGWSYGFGLSDPRTGEIMKGHVNLGSLRVRQDIRLFEGLAGVEKTGSGDPDDPVEIALARIRQLSAHEVGHTLGFTHNFAASTYDDRASVMDYPAPRVGIDAGGAFDFSEAYGVGIGSWDRHSVRFAYSEFPPGVDEEAALDQIVQDGIEEGLLFLADDDARPAGASDPRASLWDNGTDPVAELAHALRVRQLALERFGETNLASGRPLAELQEVLAPVYFHHRYQLEAAAKVIGGLEYDYTLVGDGRTATRQISPERQREALSVILTLLEPEALDLDDSILERMAPRPWASAPNREMFPTTTPPAFDPLGVAASLASSVSDHLLQPHRLGRLRDFHRRDSEQLSPAEVIGALISAAFTSTEDTAEVSPRHAELQRTVARTVAERMMARAQDPALDPELRAWLEWGLRTIRENEASSGDLAAKVHRDGLRSDIDRFLRREDQTTPTSWSTPPAPPGSPIGASLSSGCGFPHEAASSSH